VNRRKQILCCDECYEAFVMLITEDPLEAMALIEAVLIGVPPGGLDGVIILRAQSVRSGGSGSRPWVQLGFCEWCGATKGNGEP